jgi:type I restriction enzyme S subunit
VNHPWPLIPLREVLEERREAPPEGALMTGEIPIVAKIGFDDGLIHFRDTGKTRTKMLLAYPGDLVLSGINAAKGAIAVYGEENEGPIAATIHYGVYKPREERVDIRYLWWILRSAVFRNVLVQHVPGGIKTELKAKRLLPLSIPLPSKEKQEQVVEWVESMAAEVARARDLHAQSVADSSVLMESIIESVFRRFTKVQPFAHVVTFKPRSGPSFRTNPDWPGVPVLMPSAVSGFGVDLTKVEYGLGDERISEKDRLSPGDILIARGNKPRQVGNAGVVPNEAKDWVCANLLMRLQVDNTRVDPRFCIYWLRSPSMRKHVKREMKGTNPSIQKINQKTILSFPFPVGVSLNHQHRIVAYLADLQAKVDEVKQHQAATSIALDALLPSILDKAFKGEL